MDDPSSTPTETSLSPSRAEQWTLHHVLADRLDGGPGHERTAPSESDDDTATLRRAFETVDNGGMRFTREELERLQAVLAAYHHRTSWWEVERPRLEGLLERVSTALNEQGE